VLRLQEELRETVSCREELSEDGAGIQSLLCAVEAAMDKLESAAQTMLAHEQSQPHDAAEGFETDGVSRVYDEIMSRMQLQGRRRR
jgi:hypothetical protein